MLTPLHVGRDMSPIFHKYLGINFCTAEDFAHKLLGSNTLRYVTFEILVMQVLRFAATK